MTTTATSTGGVRYACVSQNGWVWEAFSSPLPEKVRGADPATHRLVTLFGPHSRSGVSYPVAPGDPPHPIYVAEKFGLMGDHGGRLDWVKAATEAITAVLVEEAL